MNKWRTLKLRVSGLVRTREAERGGEKSSDYRVLVIERVCLEER